MVMQQLKTSFHSAVIQLNFSFTIEISYLIAAFTAGSG
jgi:hypothetical protein